MKSNHCKNSIKWLKHKDRLTAEKESKLKELDPLFYQVENLKIGDKIIVDSWKVKNKEQRIEKINYRKNKVAISSFIVEENKTKIKLDDLVINQTGFFLLKSDLISCLF